MKSNQRAFTLIELLTVIVIIAILAALILGLAQYAKKVSYIKRAHSEIEKINNCIVEYKTANGKPPSTLSSIVGTLPEGLTYSNNLPVDPWYQPYQYSVVGEAYRLFSLGPTTNSYDDIFTGKY